MTNEGKQLLIKDLCGRVPNVTFVCIERDESEMELLEIGGGNEEDEPNIHTLISCDYYGECALDDDKYETVHNIKPYLRSMSSMTEDEKYIYRHMLGATINSEGESIMFVYIEDFPMVIDWLISHHFDYRGLIEKGLALEAPEGMYKNE